MKRLALLALIATALAGCVAVPVVEPHGAYIAPAPFVVVGPHHYGHGYRHWRRWH